MCRSTGIGFSESPRETRKVPRTLLAVSPFFAILSAPTTGEKCQVIFSCPLFRPTNGVDLVMLEQRPDHTIADHDRRDAEHYEFQSSEPVSSPFSHFQLVDETWS